MGHGSNPDFSKVETSPHFLELVTIAVVMRWHKRSCIASRNFFNSGTKLFRFEVATSDCVFVAGAHTAKVSFPFNWPLNFWFHNLFLKLMIQKNEMALFVSMTLVKVAVDAVLCH